MNYFSKDEFDVICASLYQAKDGVALQRLFNGVHPSLFLPPNLPSQTSLIAYVFALFSAKDFNSLFQVLKYAKFHPENCSEMVEMWHKSHEMKEETQRKKKCNAVTRFRLRQRFPPPKNIWDGEKTLYTLKDNDRKILMEFYERCPYPDNNDKQRISEMTDLSIAQVSNWFKNRRQRKKAKEVASEGGIGRQWLTENYNICNINNGNH